MLGNISNYLVLYLLFINFIGLICMFLDKRLARLNRNRISENFLISLSIIGGSIGVYLGMYCFRHKTKKIKFTLGLPIILIVHGLFWFYIS